MHAFKDNADRQWEVAINVATIKRVKGLLDVDLMGSMQGELLKKLVSDPVLLVDVLYVVCKPQAEAAGVTDEQFGEAMAGDAIERATTALLEELVDFFPSPRDRARAKRVLATFWTLIDKAQDLLDRRADPAVLESQMDQVLKKLEDSFTTSPESSASTPIP